MLESDISLRYGAAFRRCLLQLDVTGMIKLHQHAEPHLPRLTAADALVALHQARTVAKCVPKRLADYSRRWLEERAKLPGEPVVVESVGIASLCGDAGLKRALIGGMTRTARAALAAGVAAADAKTLRPLILDARQKIKRGRISI